MPKKTNFEQVPLELVKKVVEQQLNQEENDRINRRDQEQRIEAVRTTAVDERRGKREKTIRMTSMLDIFRVEPSGVRWLESAASLEGAKARVQELGLRSPGQFLVLDHKTGERHGLQVEAADGRSIITETNL